MARAVPARAVLNGRETGKTGRDLRGRFTSGAPPGPGRPAANPFGRYQAELRAALLAEVTPADVRTILRQVIRIAKRGHLPAVELLLRWTLGAPPPPVDPDRLDEHELDVKRRRPTLIDQLALAEHQAEDDLDETPVGEAETEEADTTDPDPLAPSLRQTLSWAIEELAATQFALRTQRLPPPDPAASWETFATMQLEWDPQAAVEVDALYLSYAKWCASHGEPLLEPDKAVGWLQTKGASVRTAPLSQTTTVVGVRVVA